MEWFGFEPSLFWSLIYYMYWLFRTIGWTFKHYQNKTQPTSNIACSNMDFSKLDVSLSQTNYRVLWPSRAVRVA